MKSTLADVLTVDVTHLRTSSIVYSVHCLAASVRKDISAIRMEIASNGRNVHKILKIG